MHRAAALLSRNCHRNILISVKDAALLRSYLSLRKWWQRRKGSNLSSWISIHCDVFTMDDNTVSLLLGENRIVRGCGELEMFKSKSSQCIFASLPTSNWKREQNWGSGGETDREPSTRHRAQRTDDPTGYLGLGRECDAQCAGLNTVDVKHDTLYDTLAILLKGRRWLWTPPDWQIKNMQIHLEGVFSVIVRFRVIFGNLRLKL